MKKLIAVAVTALGLTLTLALSACAPNGSTTTPVSAPNQNTASQTPTPTPTVHVAVEVSLEGDPIAWSDVVAVHERGDLPVLWLTPEAGSTLTLVGSSSVYEFSTDGGMTLIRNSDNDAVFSPKLSPFDGSVVGSGGEVCADGDVYFCFKVNAVQP